MEDKHYLILRLGLNWHVFRMQMLLVPCLRACFFCVHVSQRHGDICLPSGASFGSSFLPQSYAPHFQIHLTLFFYCLSSNCPLLSPSLPPSIPSLFFPSFSSFLPSSSFLFLFLPFKEMLKKKNYRYLQCWVNR